ncbi:MAG: ATP-binding protein [Tumebacillaceae bacterium]
MVQATRRLAVFCFSLMCTAGVVALLASFRAYLMSQPSTSDLALTSLLASSVSLLCLLLYVLLRKPRQTQDRSDSHSPTQQLYALQQQCDFLLNSIDHGVLVIDLEAQISFVNDEFCRMFHYDRDRLLGTVTADLARQHPDEPIALAYRLVTQTKASGESQSMLLDLPQPDGGFRHLEILATLLKDQSQRLLGFLLSYRDRTAERELQESMRRNDQLETVSQMAASIAHEVRNPMTSVQGFLQLMSKEVDPTHTHSMYLHVMEEDLKRINSIITEYLNFSRMGSDSLEDVWVGTLLHNTYTLLQSEANLKGIELILSLSGSDPLLIANANRLKQVLINLARNGMEAMIAQGGGKLTLALETTPDDIVLMVKDTGPGISTYDMERIFKPFYTTKETGTGLGLFVCKKIVEEHNGTIRVQTEEGYGTIFSIYLPKNRLFEEN